MRSSVQVLTQSVVSAFVVTQLGAVGYLMTKAEMVFTLVNWWRDKYGGNYH